MKKLFSLAFFFLFLESISAQNSAIAGFVFADNDQNCFPSAFDQTLNDIIIEAKDSLTGNLYYAATSFADGGYYEIRIPPGTYSVKATLPYSQEYFSFCQNNIVLTSTLGLTDTINFFAQPISNCSKVLADIVSVGIPDCGSSKYWIRLENIGTSPATGVQLELELDSLMTLDSSSVAFSPLGNNRFVTFFGNLGNGRDSSIYLDIICSHCAVVSGQTLSVKVKATTNNECEYLWQGPFVKTEANVLGDSIIFTARNIGSVNMSQAPRTRVIIDDVMYSPPFPALDTSSPITFTITAEPSKTYRFEIEQDSSMPYYIGAAWAWSALEGAIPDGQGTFNTGYYTQFFTDDADASTAIECRETENLILFNRKTTEVKGYGSSRLIEKRMPIEYKINFINTTANLVQNLEILDTIPSFLDINTLRIGSSSHEGFDLKILPGNVLRIFYPQILLSNTAIDSSNSYGAINFYFQAKSDILVGSVIENKALIIFNSSDTIRTQTAYNTVGENFIQILSYLNFDKKHFEVDIFPNPTKGILNIKIEESEFSVYRFEIIDILGRKVFSDQSAKNNRIVNLPNIEQGVYFYRVWGDKILLDKGRVVIGK